MSIFAACCLFVLSYLLGAIPFALLLGRLRGVDIRTVGSGNIGATNLTRALGRRWGVAAFLLDFLKGFLPVLVSGWLGSTTPPPGGISYPHVQIACALAAVLGHIFPVYLRFHGGKGVATAFGALAALAWKAALAAGGIWLIIFLVTRTVSMASIAAALAFPAATIVICHVIEAEPLSAALPKDILTVLVGILIVIRHRSNIRRLLKGKESRF